jgi:uncharacterized protein with HEPN domain
MTRHAKKYLFDIKQSIEYIQSYIADHDNLAAFAEDVMTLDAIERRVAIIGEATFKLKKMGVLFAATDSLINRRNTIVHQYDEFTPRAIWRHIHEDLPAILTEVSDLLNSPDTPS